MVGWYMGADQMEAEEQGAEGRDGEDIDKVAGQAAEPRTRSHSRLCWHAALGSDGGEG